MTHRPVRVAVVGATASGKSAVALKVAQRAGSVGLVSVDSMQVYRGMDIGTAKPSLLERRMVSYYCIDLVDADEDFTVADFRRAYASALDSIAAVGHRAVLVGGTGLYYRVVLDGFELPGEFPDVRCDLEGESDTTTLYRRLLHLDPEAATKMESTNRRRIVRALEVTIGSGRPFSSYGPGMDCYRPSPVEQIGLRWPRPLLARRIERRVHQMIADGLVAEVATLYGRGFSRTAHQALGYKEIVAFLEGGMSEDEAIAATIIRTRQLAVRQERWFRRDPRIRWIDIEADPVAECSPTIVKLLEQASA